MVAKYDGKTTTLGRQGEEEETTTPNNGRKTWTGMGGTMNLWLGHWKNWEGNRRRK
jgi:hypothetical protein